MAQFPSTHWSLIEGGVTRSAQALNRLLAHYWHALHCRLVLRWGLSHDLADDLLQEFLTDKFLERNLVHRYDPRKGRFRTLILTALDNFVKSALRKSTAKKRAAIATVSIEDDQLDCVADQPQDTSEFDTEWALQVIRQVLEKVETESRLKGQDHYWILYERRVLDPAITGTKPPEYISMLEELGFTSATVAANALQTVQRRVRRVAEQIVAEYELSSGDVENELRALRGILSRSSSPS